MRSELEALSQSAPHRATGGPGSTRARRVRGPQRWTLRGIVAVWAALGVVLTGATQLRADALPIGPGEVLLAAWTLFVGLLLLLGVGFRIGKTFGFFLFFWLSSWSILAFGAATSTSMGKLHTATVMHDSLAFLFIGSLSCFWALDLNEDDKAPYHQRVARALFFMLAGFSVILLGLALVQPGLGPIDFWWAYRFRGWAHNPNQLALLMVAMPFLGWWLLQHTRGRASKLAHLLGIAACVVVGLATYSDGLRVAWATTLGGLGMIAWLRAVVHSRGKVMYLTHSVVPFVVVVLGYSLSGELMAEFERISRAIYEEGEQGSIRITLWRHGIEAILLSPLVGFGPGAYSGMYGPFEGIEAHNMLIDWGMSTGLLGVLLHLALLLMIGWRTLKTGSLALLGVLTSLVMFGVFAHTLRQPIYWLVLVLAFSFVEQRRPAPARQRQPMPAPPRRALHPVQP